MVVKFKSSNIKSGFCNEYVKMNNNKINDLKSLIIKTGENEKKTFNFMCYDRGGSKIPGKNIYQ